MSAFWISAKRGAGSAAIIPASHSAGEPFAPRPTCAPAMPGWPRNFSASLASAGQPGFVPGFATAMICLSDIIEACAFFSVWTEARFCGKSGSNSV